MTVIPSTPSPSTTPAVALASEQTLRDRHQYDLTANCETLEQLGCRSSSAICLFCRQPSNSRASTPSQMSTCLVQLFRVLSTYPHLPLSSHKNGAGWSSKTLPRTCQGNFSRQMSCRSGIFGIGVRHKQTHA